MAHVLEKLEVKSHLDKNTNRTLCVSDSTATQQSQQLISDLGLWDSLREMWTELADNQSSPCCLPVSVSFTFNSRNKQIIH